MMWAPVCVKPAPLARILEALIPDGTREFVLRRRLAPAGSWSRGRAQPAQIAKAADCEALLVLSPTVTLAACSRNLGRMTHILRCALVTAGRSCRRLTRSFVRRRQGPRNRLDSRKRGFVSPSCHDVCGPRPKPVCDTILYGGSRRSQSRVGDACSGRMSEVIPRRSRN